MISHGYQTAVALFLPLTKKNINNDQLEQRANCGDATWRLGKLFFRCWWRTDYESPKRLLWSDKHMLAVSVYLCPRHCKIPQKNLNASCGSGWTPSGPVWASIPGRKTSLLPGHNGRGSRKRRWKSAGSGSGSNDAAYNPVTGRRKQATRGQQALKRPESTKSRTLKVLLPARRRPHFFLWLQRCGGGLIPGNGMGEAMIHGNNCQGLRTEALA